MKRSVWSYKGIYSPSLFFSSPQRSGALIELAGLLVSDIVSSAISKEAGTWEVDLKSSIGFGSNFTLSRHTLFLSAAARPRYGNANNVGVRGLRGLFASTTPSLSSTVQQNQVRGRNMFYFY